MKTIQSEDILKFWFQEIDASLWWKKDNNFDALLSERFGSVHRQAVLCELSHWRVDARGRLAEIIILDQFSRNIFRDTPAAFAQDAQALTLAQEAVAQGHDAELSPIERAFMYLPYMHSESPMVHQTAVALYEANGLAQNLDFEMRHKAIIERFGRYPHRNGILGRTSTVEEENFLKEPGSSF